MKRDWIYQCHAWKARAVDGERAVASIPTKGEKVSLIGALNLDGLVAAIRVPGSTNTEVFLTYVTHVLVPQLWSGAIVVMDNRGCSSCSPYKSCYWVSRCIRQMFATLLSWLIPHRTLLVLTEAISPWLWGTYPWITRQSFGWGCKLHYWGWCLRLVQSLWSIYLKTAVIRIASSIAAWALSIWFWS